MMVLHLALFIGAGGTATGHASHHAGHTGASAATHAGHSGGDSADTLPAGTALDTEMPATEVQSAGMQGAGMLGIAGLELAVAWSAGLALRRQR
jgi:hypothetical protein